MKTIREMAEAIPEHILDMDLEKTFLVGITTTDIEVQVDKLRELGIINGSLSEENSLFVLRFLAETFDPETGIGNALIRKTIVDLLARQDIVLL